MKYRSSMWLAGFLLGVTALVVLGYLFAGQQSADDSPQAKGDRPANQKGRTNIAQRPNGVWWYSITGSNADDFGEPLLPIIGDYGQALTLDKDSLGALFLDVDSGRFVYHVFDRADGTESAVGTPAKDRPLLDIATGFDGKVYWEAWFVKRIHYKRFFRSGFSDSASWSATDVEVYRSLKTRVPGGWLLHDLFEYIDCDTWDYASITKAFNGAAPYGREVTDEDKDLLKLARSSGFVGDGPFFSYQPWGTTNDRLRPIGRANREYLVQLDQEVPALKMCRVDYLGVFWGVLPLLPRPHFFIRQGQLSEFPSTMFSFRHYVDAEAVIRYVDTGAPEDEKEK